MTIRADGLEEAVVAAFARDTGCAAAPGAADPQAPVVALVSSPDQEALAAALALPAAACVEVAAGGGDRSNDPSLRTDGLYLSMFTATAYTMEPARAFCEALAERVTALPPDFLPMLELAVHEGLVNAMVHGNLGIGSLTKDSLEDFMLFCQTIEGRLGDPAFGGRRVRLHAQWTADQLDIAIQDEGAGYDAATLNDPNDPNRKSGRGLFLIRDLAREVVVEDGGRRLVMRFAR